MEKQKNNLQRIQKLIAQAGICSRRQAENLILQQKVKLNGKIALLGQKASFQDQILVDEVEIFLQEKIYFILNKPRKTICALKDPQNRNLVVNLIKHNSFIFPVGRLDYNSTGIILLTNDGDLSHKLLHPSSRVLRVYRVVLERDLTEKEIWFLNKKNHLIDGIISLHVVEKITSKIFKVSLNQGLNHHIKKLFAFVKVRVQNLERIQFAMLNCLGLKRGEYRKLKIHEVKLLKNLANFATLKKGKKNVRSN